MGKREIERFKELVKSGQNNSDSIGRLASITANDFFRACYAQRYLKHADGRVPALILTALLTGTIGISTENTVADIPGKL